MLKRFYSYVLRFIHKGRWNKREIRIGFQSHSRFRLALISSVPTPISLPRSHDERIQIASRTNGTIRRVEKMAIDGGSTRVTFFTIDHRENNITDVMTGRRPVKSFANLSPKLQSIRSSLWIKIVVNCKEGGKGGGWVKWSRSSQSYISIKEKQTRKTIRLLSLLLPWKSHVALLWHFPFRWMNTDACKKKKKKTMKYSLDWI